MQQNCEMGLFPEVSRAWLTIDSNIFLWAYDNSQDIAFYDGLTETIIGVGLITPKKGIFREHIRFLLCLTTSVEIVLLGVTFPGEGENPDSSDLLLVPEPMFKLPTDNSIMNVVCGTKDGRIFLGSKDGSLYEAIYRAEEGWFSRKSEKINHSRGSLSLLLPSFLSPASNDPIIQIEIDDSRHILYSRSESGTIDVYDLGQDGTETSKVASRSASYIVQQASNIARTVDPSQFKPVVHISIVEDTLSSFITLQAITESGVRLFFTTFCDSRGNERPAYLNVVHVRLPPGFSPTSTQRPTRVHLSHQRRGTTLMITAQNEEKDTLWIISNENFPSATDMTEVYSTFPLESRVWKMVEEQRPQTIKQLVTSRPVGAEKPLILEPPMVVTQHMEEPRKFVLLSSQGVHIGFKPRPADSLRQILNDNQGYENDAVKGFFSLFGELQAAAICLSLASCPLSSTDKQVSEWATLAFFRFTGETATFSTFQSPQSIAMTPQFASSPIYPYSTSPPDTISRPTIVQSTGYPSQIVSTPVSSNVASVDNFPGSPIYGSSQLQQPLSPSAVASPLTEFSARHNSIYLYFSRIIRPFWHYGCVTTHVNTTELGLIETLTSSLSESELVLYIQKLSGLKEFMSKNLHFSGLKEARPEDSRNIHSGHERNQVQVRERTSLNSMFFLLNHCLEVLGLWKIITDHQFQTIASHLPGEIVNRLKSSTFRELVISGLEVCARLASCLVQKYIEDHSTTDAISRRLSDSCPSIFKQENALEAKAHEKIIKARIATSEEERSSLVSEAAQLLKRVGGRINLPEACELLQSVNSYKNIIDLCVLTASQRDPQNLALHFYKNNEPENDLAGNAAFIHRVECYKIMLRCYEKLLAKSEMLLQPSSSAPIQSSQTPDNLKITKEEAARFANMFLNEVIHCPDEPLHVSVYEWLFAHLQNDRLLQIKSPYLEDYLKRKTTTCSESIQLMDLLWMFYERNGHFRAAAEILTKLSERHGNSVPLYQRLEYLSRAIVCMKGCQTSLSSKETKDMKPAGEFLHELEEKMDVARIQLQILEMIRDSTSHDINSRLNSDLLNITDLYDLSERLDLPEIQLSIVYAANHYDPALIEGFWQKIIDNCFMESTSHSSVAIKIILENKILTLGKIYMPSEKFFPICEYFT